MHFSPFDLKKIDFENLIQKIESYPTYCLREIFIQNSPDFTKK